MDKALQQSEALRVPCEYFGRSCPCQNQKCEHGISGHETCYHCGRYVSPRQKIWREL